MKRLLTFSIFLLLPLLLAAQYSPIPTFNLRLEAGWTASKIQTQAPELYDANQAPYESEAFSVLHSPYAALEVECDFRHLFASAGLSYMALGSRRTPIGNQKAWRTYYLSVPLNLGYQIFLSEHGRMILEGGAEIGLPLSSSTNYQDQATSPVNVNAIAGIQFRWKRLSIGTRLQVGVNKFATVQGNILRHSAITTYIGAAMWIKRRRQIAPNF